MKTTKLFGGNFRAAGDSASREAAVGLPTPENPECGLSGATCLVRDETCDMDPTWS